MKPVKEAIEKVIKDIEKSKYIIAIERDKLRTLSDEIEDLLYSFDAGIDSLEIGISELEAGIDSISEVV